MSHSYFKLHSRIVIILTVFQLLSFSKDCIGQITANNISKSNKIFIDKSDTLTADVVVAKDGSGDFSTIAAALDFLMNVSDQRVIVFIKDGVYTEKLTINRPNVTLVGESRKGTRIEYSIPAGNESPSRGVLNIFGDGIILKNLTVKNTYPHRRHTFALYGRGSFVITEGCDFIANGNDTVALWAIGGGYYYHKDCHFEGNIDYLCPRGWCYVTNSTFYEVDTRAALWHDGGKDPNKKLVITNSKFSGARKYALGRYPRDAQFYLIGCNFSDSTEDILDTNAPKNPTEDFQWGRRAFFYNCHKDGGDATWHSNNLNTAPGSPNPQSITAAWTFDHKWNPERKDAPRVVKVSIGSVYKTVNVMFSEPITVHGSPVITTKKGKIIRWTMANGTNTLTFSPLDKDDYPERLELNGGAIFASDATIDIRHANLKLKP